MAYKCKIFLAVTYHFMGISILYIHISVKLQKLLLQIRKLIYICQTGNT